MNNPKVAIILGSESDLEMVVQSKMLPIFNDVEVSYELSVISAHRNPHELDGYCNEAPSRGVAVFIGVAGMAAALPGAIVASLGQADRNCPVIGVPLPSTHFANGEDALLAMVQMPPGVPVSVCGIGKPGLANAALMACKILSLSDPEIDRKLRAYNHANNKPAKLDIKVKVN